MQKIKVLMILLVMVIMGSATGYTYHSVFARPSAATSPGLGVANSFSVLAESRISNVPNSTIGADVGLSPATGADIGLSDSEVAGTIYAVDGAGPAGAINDPGLLTNAINAMMATFTSLDQPCTVTYAGVQDLTIVSPLIEGVYCADAFLLTGNLTLSGSGVWIFKSAATLTTSAGSSVTGGDPCSVWWRLVSSADLGSNSSMIGNILAGTSINMQTGASLNGRVLAQAAVTLDQNTIGGPVCVSLPANTSTPVFTATSTTSAPVSTSASGASASSAEQTMSAMLTSTAAVGVNSLPGTGGAPLWLDEVFWSILIITAILAVGFFSIKTIRSTNRMK